MHKNSTYVTSFNACDLTFIQSRRDEFEQHYYSGKLLMILTSYFAQDQDMAL